MNNETETTVAVQALAAQQMEAPEIEAAETASSAAGEMFAAPLSSAMAAVIAAEAKAAFEAGFSAPVLPALPVSQLRATLRDLAPLVRRDAELCDPGSAQEFDRNGDFFDVRNIVVTPLLAHFALVSLALVEAESSQGDASAPSGGGATVPPIEPPAVATDESDEEPTSWPEIADALRTLAAFAESLHEGTPREWTDETDETRKLCEALELARVGVGYLAEEFSEEVARATEWRRRDLEAFAALKIELPEAA